jgi:predicted nucleic acid-binding protein
VIVVDTSVWVEAVRRPDDRPADVLRSLIDADEVGLPLPVRMELMAGIARKDRKAFARGLSALPVLVPSEETWTIAEGWIAPAADAGQRFAVTDLVIGALADQAGALIWSLDDDFVRLEALGFARLYTPTRAAGRKGA